MRLILGVDAEKRVQQAEAARAMEDTFIRNRDAKFLVIPPSNEHHLIYVVGGESHKDDA